MGSVEGRIFASFMFESCGSNGRSRPPPIPRPSPKVLKSAVQSTQPRFNDEVSDVAVEADVAAVAVEADVAAVAESCVTVVGEVQAIERSISAASLKALKLGSPDSVSTTRGGACSTS